MSQDEERRIRAVLDEVWPHGRPTTPTAWSPRTPEEATALLPGSVLPSREAIRETMVQVFAGPLKGTKSVEAFHTAPAAKGVGVAGGAARHVPAAPSLLHACGVMGVLYALAVSSSAVGWSIR